jgi:outer membrane receptor protein involved in Fe transport
MDLVLGTGSVQFGSDAMGGALSVNYRSANYSKEKNLALSKVGGSTRVSAPTTELSQRIFIDFSSDKIALTTGITFRKFGDVVVPGSDANKSVKLSPTGYSEINGDFNLRLKARNGEWTFAGNTVNQRNIPVYHKIALENFEKNAMDRQDRHLLYLRRTFNVNRATQVKFTAGLQNSYESRSMQKRNSDKLTQETDVVQTQFFLTELNQQLSRNWSLSSGYEFYRDKVLSSRYNTNTLTGNTLSSRGLYPDHSGLFQHSVFLMSKGVYSRFEFTGGLRLQQTSSEMNIEPIGEILDRNLALVQTLGLSIDLSELNPIKGGELRVFSNYSSGFRAPNLDDLGTLGIVDFRYEVPQYDLRPEYSKNHEIGFKFRSKGVRAQISAYKNFLFDVISRTKS